MNKLLILIAALLFAVSSVNGAADASTRKRAAPVVEIRVDISSQSMAVDVDGWPYARWKVSTARQGYYTPRGAWRPFALKKMHYSRKYDNSPMPNSIFFLGGYAIHATYAVGNLGGPHRTAASGFTRTVRRSCTAWCRSTGSARRGSAFRTEVTSSGPGSGEQLRSPLACVGFPGTRTSSRHSAPQSIKGDCAMRMILGALALPMLFGLAQAQDMSKMMMMKPGAEMSEADKGYMTAMQGMSDSMMKTELTGDPEGDFVRMMIPHHTSAVDMAETVLKQKDIDPKIAKMAEKIRTDQLAEIAIMQKWLAANPQ